MSSHNEKYNSPYSVQQIFDIIVDVEQYPNFLPWVSGCKIHERSDDEIIAELFIKFKAFRGSYTSKIILTKPDIENVSNAGAFVDVSLVRGPFKNLSNSWKLYAQEDGSTQIVFHLDFEFKSRILSKMLSVVFGTAVDRMVESFELRAEEIYGEIE